MVLPGGGGGGEEDRVVVGEGGTGEGVVIRGEQLSSISHKSSNLISFSPECSESRSGADKGMSRQGQ